MKNLLLLIFTFPFFISYSQCPFTSGENWGGGGASCACSWIDASGDANCSFGNCSAGNQTTWESTCDGTYYFQHPDPIQLCQSIILPIRLVNFYGEYNSPTNEITWVTGSEKNNDFFIIYTSTDAEEWIEVSRLPGAGNVSDERKYRVQH